MSDITERLRAEINKGKQYRHEFAMRKFSTTTILLGAGSLKSTAGVAIAGIDFTLMLFLVPLVALAFDMFILAEDYRIKRAGEFIGSRPDLAIEGEAEWEKYCKNNNNELATISSAFMTVIFIFISIVLLFQAEKYRVFLLPWILLIFIILVALVIISRRMRKSFKLQPQNNSQSANAGG